MAKRKIFVDYISPDLRKFAVPVGDLVFDADNEREHSPEQVVIIANSLKEHGQDQLIVVEKDTNLIIKGHGRVMAAKSLGWTHIAALMVGKDDESKRAARRLIDNRSAELATWNMGALARTAKGLKESGVSLNDIGFKDDEVSQLLGLLEPENQDAVENDLVMEENKPKFPDPIRLTWDQKRIFDLAYESIKAELGDGLSEGRVIELVCADYLSGRGVVAEENITQEEKQTEQRA